MKLLRHGPSGAENPGIAHSDGTIRDLTGIVPDIAGAVLSDAGLAIIRANILDKLPVVDADPGLGSWWRGPESSSASGSTILTTPLKPAPPCSPNRSSS